MQAGASAAGEQPHTYTMASHIGPGVPGPQALDTSREMRLHTKREERERAEELAELYSVLKATEMLEAAFEKGHISAGACTLDVQQGWLLCDLAFHPRCRLQMPTRLQRPA